MRLLRLRLRDFRGVVDREVVFAPAGVTVIEGPNEVGKSTLAEALDLLLDELDSANTKAIRDVKPVDRDVGPEVELEAESGPYAFTFRKRFLRDRQTVLVITQPRPESLTGREAHERLRAILSRTADLALWKALRISQGRGVAQASVDGIGSLSSALDRAAGTVPAGPAEIALIERAKQEYARYWTDTGRPRADAATLAQRVVDAERGLAEVEAELRRLDEDVTAVARLGLELDDLAVRAATAAAEAEQRTAAWHRIASLAAAAQTADAEAATARLDAGNKAAAAASRAVLIAALGVAVAERDRLAAAAAATAPDVEAAQQLAAAAANGLEVARAATAAADDLERAARAELEVIRARRALGDLLARRRRVEIARAALAEAESTLAANRVDADAIARIRHADLGARTARALRDVAGPAVTITALGPVAIEVNGEHAPIAPGTAVRRPVADELEVRVPGQVSVRVVAGTGAEQAARDVAAAEDALRGTCRAVGVADLAEAELAASARAEAAGVRTSQLRTLVELLGPNMERALVVLESRIAAAQTEIGAHDGPAGARVTREDDDDAGVAAAAVAAETAARAAADARAALAIAGHDDRLARDRHVELDKRAAADRVHADVAAAAAVTAQAALDAARSAVSDACLEAADVEAASAVAARDGAAVRARAALDAAGPDAARALLDRAVAARSGVEAAIRTAELDLAGARARLADRGESGLAEKRDSLVTARDAAIRARDASATAAGARKLLYDALVTARREAHLAYIGPLRDRVEALGRIVFGPDLRVEIGEDLRVRQRTLDGRTLPFESLSVGAQEQLGIISRLACAMIVAPDGGVPVVLDDGLGWSDPTRLEAMGAVLNKAGEHCQVIVLTCYPDRYRAVGGATVVRLG